MLLLSQYLASEFHFNVTHHFEFCLALSVKTQISAAVAVNHTAKAPHVLPADRRLCPASPIKAFRQACRCLRCFPHLISACLRLLLKIIHCSQYIRMLTASYQLNTRLHSRYRRPFFSRQRAHLTCHLVTLHPA